METLLDAYIECALWADSPEDDDYCVTELAPPTRAAMARDCATFEAQAGELIADDIRQAGHDFWLTRQGHGAGFWDGDWPSEIGARLTALAKRFGSFDLYRGDDGLIYAMGAEG